MYCSLVDWGLWSRKYSRTKYSGCGLKKVLLQVVFKCFFCIPALNWVVNNIFPRIALIQLVINLK